MTLACESSEEIEKITDCQTLIAINIFEFLCKEMILVLTEYALKLSNDSKLCHSVLENECIALILLMNETKQGSCLVPVFIFRPLLIKYGMILQSFIGSKLRK